MGYLSNIAVLAHPLQENLPKPPIPLLYTILATL